MNYRLSRAESAQKGFNVRRSLTNLRESFHELAGTPGRARSYEVKESSSDSTEEEVNHVNEWPCSKFTRQFLRALSSVPASGPNTTNRTFKLRKASNAPVETPVCSNTKVLY